MQPTRRALQQQAQCRLTKLGSIGVALDSRLAQRILPHSAQHERRVRYGCRHQCLLTSSIGACGLVPSCATNALHEAVGQHVRDEQMQQRSDHRRGRVRQLAVSELAQSWRAPRTRAPLLCWVRNPLFQASMAGVKGQLARTSAPGLKSRRPAPHDGLATPQPAGGGLCGLPGFRGGSARAATAAARCYQARTVLVRATTVRC